MSDHRRYIVEDGSSRSRSRDEVIESPRHHHHHDRGYGDETVERRSRDFDDRRRSRDYEFERRPRHHDRVRELEFEDRNRSLPRERRRIVEEEEADADLRRRRSHEHFHREIAWTDEEKLARRQARIKRREKEERLEKAGLSWKTTGQHGAWVGCSVLGALAEGF